MDHAVKLLHASLACATMLGSKNNMKLVQYLIKRVADMKYIDGQGNSFLHHACQATESNAFLQACFVNDELPTQRNLLQHLIATFPKALTLQNTNGETPLQLAIQSKKKWDFLRLLCPDSAAGAVMKAKTCQGQLALHLAIESYPPSSSEILHLWDCYPEAAIILDHKHRLFAFQLVATFSGQHRRETKQAPTMRNKHKKSMDYLKYMRDQDLDLSRYMQDLDLVFFFVKAYPQVLQQLD